MREKSTLLWRLATACSGALMLLVLLSSTMPRESALANHEPANKVSAAGSSTEVFGPPMNGTSVVTLLSERVKTSKPTDLILGVTCECSITTEVTTIGTDTQGAEGSIRVWVEVDGVPVPVSTNDPDVGRVVFCNRLYERTTQLGSDDEQDSIRTFMRTRSANGFNWMALNVGSATHLIEVKAELTTSSTARSSALAVVGNRTLIVEPVKSANDETVTELAVP
jgi:hypothetical protein